MKLLETTLWRYITAYDDTCSKLSCSRIHEKIDHKELEENMGKYLSDLTMGDNFLNSKSKEEIINQKTEDLTYKIINSYLLYI